MKQLFFAAFFSLLLLAACNSGKSKNKTGTNTDKEATEKATEEANKVKDAAAGIEKIKEQLTNLSPLTAEQLKAMLPEKLLGASLSNAEVENSSGANIATGDYELSDTNSITLSIIDCAGPGGVGIYNMQFLGMVNAQQETDEEYTKATTINGQQGFEHCIKEDNDCTIAWFAGDRYLVSLEGTGADALKQAARSIQIK